MPYKKIALFIGVIIVIIIALLGIAYLAQEGNAPENETLTNNKGYTIELDDNVPEYTRPIAYGDTIPADVREVLDARLQIVIATLDADRTNPSGWYELAVLYKTANDLEGARMIWEFLTLAAPQDVVAFDNLGKLYHFDLREYEKAEGYFKKSLEINPESETAYLELFDLYRYSYKQDTSAAVDIMRSAMQKFPTNAGYPFALGVYYRDQGQTTRARAEFNTAIGIARAAGDIDAVGAINAELARLP